MSIAKGWELTTYFILINSCLIGNIASQVTYEPSASTADIVLAQPLVTPSPNVLATSVILTFPPGDAGSPPHFHSGPTVGYVLEGEFLFQVKGGPIRIIPAGSSFYELDRATHIWGGNASNTTTCKVHATIYGRPNESFLTFIANYPRESRSAALAKAVKGK